MHLNVQLLSAGRRRTRGFTLLEILIALFIFTIVAMISTRALQTVINAQEKTESSAMRLRELQVALLVMSREVEQAIDRPILNSVSKEEPAFKGSQDGFTFTHLGLANPTGAEHKSALARSGYIWKDNALYRLRWESLDQAPKSKPHIHLLCKDVINARFSYLNGEGRFGQKWPLESEAERAVPRAVKVELEIEKWGKLSQIYVIPAEPVQIQSALPEALLKQEYD